MDDGGKSKAGKGGRGTEEGPVKHYHGHRERLRQRVLTDDGGHLADYELLELLLCAFIPRVDVKPIAKELIARFGSVSGALAASPERLMAVKGVGETAAAYIRAGNPLMQQAAGDAVKDGPVISNWAALLNYVKLALRHEKNEQARVIYLGAKNKLIADEIVGRGTVDHAPVHPSEIARHALELSACAIILVHNHPSGDPTPSRADIDLTREIERALARRRRSAWRPRPHLRSATETSVTDGRCNAASRSCCAAHPRLAGSNTLPRLGSSIG